MWWGKSEQQSEKKDWRDRLKLGEVLTRDGNKNEIFLVLKGLRAKEWSWCLFSSFYFLPSLFLHSPGCHHNPSFLFLQCGLTPTLDLDHKGGGEQKRFETKGREPDIKERKRMVERWRRKAMKRMQRRENGCQATTFSFSLLFVLESNLAWVRRSFQNQGHDKGIRTFTLHYHGSTCILPPSLLLTFTSVYIILPCVHIHCQTFDEWFGKE